MVLIKSHRKVRRRHYNPKNAQKQDSNYPTHRHKSLHYDIMIIYCFRKMREFPMQNEVIKIGEHDSGNN